MRRGKNGLAAEMKGVGRAFSKNPARPSCVSEPSKHLSLFLMIKMGVILWKVLLLQNWSRLLFPGR